MYQLGPKQGNGGLIPVGYPAKNGKTVYENEFAQKIRQTAEEYGYAALLLYLHPPGEGHFAISHVMEAPEYAGKGALNDAAGLLSEDIDYVPGCASPLTAGARRSIRAAGKKEE